MLVGWQLVAVFGIIALAVIVYYAFVFGRAIKVKGEIEKEIKGKMDKEKKRLELEAGRKVR